MHTPAVRNPRVRPRWSTDAVRLLESMHACIHMCVRRLTLGQRGTDFVYTGASGGWLKALLILGTSGSRCPRSSTMKPVLLLRELSVVKRVPLSVVLHSCSTATTGTRRTNLAGA